jgi:hypothetical protein
MVKRILAMLLAVMMVWTAVPVQVSADTAGTADTTNATGKYKDFTYNTLDDKNSVEITEYTGTASSVTIPLEIESSPVEKIGDNAFKNTNIKSVKIQSNITSIGAYAFAGCTTLSSITIPNSVKSIGSHAFYKCTALTKVEIPKSVTVISDRLFQGCTALTDITLPDTVATIEEAAFAQCSALQTIDLPKNLTTIGAKVFYECSALKSISIPEGITVIPEKTFYSCTSLKSIWIPKTVKTIEKNAFENTTSFDTVKYQGTQTEWSGITIDRDEGGNNALPSASNITYNATLITDGDTTDTSGTSTQAGDTSSKTDTQTGSTTKPISSCTVTVQATSVTYTGSDITPFVTVKDGATTLTQNTDYTVAYSNNTNVGTAAVTVTGKGNYTGTATKTFTIEAAKVSLKTAVITLEYVSVPYDGKEKKPAVKSVVVNSSTLKEKTDYTVSYTNNTNVGTATVTITGAGNYIDTATKTFTIEKTSIAGGAVTLETRSYKYDGTAKTPKVTELKVNGNTLKENTDYTVSYKNNTEIGTATVTVAGAGSYTGTLERIFLIQPENTSLEAAGVTLSKSSYYYDGTTKKPAVELVKLGDNILNKGTDYTVSYKNNKNIGTASVVITGAGGYSDSVTETFEIKAKTGTTFTSGTGKYKITDENSVTFTGLSKSTTKSLTIPATVKYGGKSLEVTAIKAKALKGKNITKVVVKNNVSTIGESAFENCKKLTSVKLGTGMFEIGENAFKNCKKLATITINSKILESVGENAFKGIKSNAKINVPDDQLEFYKELLADKGQGSKVKIKGM